MFLYLVYVVCILPYLPFIIFYRNMLTHLTRPKNKCYLGRMYYIYCNVVYRTLFCIKCMCAVQIANQAPEAQSQSRPTATRGCSLI